MKDQIYHHYVKENLNIKEVAKKLNISTSTVWREIQRNADWPRKVLNKAKITGRKKKYNITPDIKEIESLYNSGETELAIARKLGTTRWQISKHINNSNIKKRNTGHYIPNDVVDKLNNKDWLFENHVTNKKCIENIASELKISSFPVLKALRKNNIEINGLYWHSTATKRNIDKKYHQDKAIACNAKGVKLLQFFEDEWKNKKDICKNIILSNISHKNKIHGRKCKVSEITSSESGEFCKKYHLQGPTGASVHIGCFYENELVSIMTFKKSRFSKKVSWEIIRYCTKSGINVLGGASKMFSHFMKLYDPDSVCSYADLRISNGRVYESLGFKFSHTTQPNYSYVVGKERSNRLNWQKKRLKNKLKNFNPSLSESINMELNGFHRIYDAGNKLFVWTKQTNS